MTRNPTYCTVGKTVKNIEDSKKSVDEIAKEVIQGKSGNGTERKEKLTAAGYDYATVQKRVNEMLAYSSCMPSYILFKSGESRDEP